MKKLRGCVPSEVNNASAALHTCINKRPALKIVVVVLPKLIAGTGSTVYTSVYICIYTNIYIYIHVANADTK